MNLTGMKLFLRERRQSVLGLDLGSASIKLVQLVNKGEGFSLVRADLREIPSTEDPASRESQRLRLLKELLNGVSLKDSIVQVTLNSPEGGVKIFTTPSMPKAEFREAIHFEGKRLFPLPPEETVLDFQEVGETHDKGIKKIRMAVALFPRKVIDEVLSLLKKAGIRPSLLIPSSWALQTLAGMSKVRSEETRCVTDMGESQSELLILKGKNLLFSRKIPVGGRDFTQAMTGVYASDRGRIEVGWEEAEQIKRQVGFALEHEGESLGGKISGAQLLSMLRSPLERFINEIEHSFDYYREESGGEGIQNLVLFGRGALLKGLPHHLSEHFGMDVRLGNPLDEIKIEAQVVIPEEGFSQYAIALGGALSGGRGLNLLPPEIKEEAKRTLQRATLQSAIAATILTLIFLYVGLRIQLSNLDKRISVARMELSSLQLDLGEAEKQRWARNISVQQPYWEDILRELSNVIPMGAALTELKVDEQAKRITLRGAIRSIDREGTLSRMIHDLEEGMFRNVRLVKAEEKPGEEASEFEIEAWVDSGT